MRALPARLVATDEHISRLRESIESFWPERRPGAANLSGACVFATATARLVFGGRAHGNWHHVHLRSADGTLVDLTAGAGIRQAAAERLALHAADPRFALPPHWIGEDVEPLLHDPAFIRSRDFLEVWQGVQPRARDWARHCLTSPEIAERPGVERGCRRQLVDRA